MEYILKKHMRKSGQRLWIAVLIFGLIFLCGEVLSTQYIKTLWVDVQTTVIKNAEESLGMIIEKEEKKIALTFDDGPHPIYTPKLLEGLRERGVVATFFVTGANATLYPELIAQMQEDGHVVGNHTYHHVQLSSVGEEFFLQELKETNRVLEGILEEEVLYVRPPFGDWTKSIEKEINMFPVLWDIDPLDWCTGNTAQIVKKVLDNAEDNSIVLMHDEYATSVEAALQIVDELLEDGYQFVTVEEILLK